MTPQEIESVRQRIEDYKADPEMGAAWHRWTEGMVLELLDALESLGNMFSDLAREAPVLLRERDAALSGGHCASCTCGCTCGYGGDHVEGNPLCERTIRALDGEES